MKRLMILLFLMLLIASQVQAGFQFGGDTSKFKIGNNGNLHINNQLTVDSGIFDYQTAGQLTTNTSYPLVINNGIIITDGGKGIVNGTISLNTSLATQMSGDSLYADSGLKLGAIAVSSIDNKLSGDLLFTANNPFLTSDNGITLQDSSTTLTLALTSPLSKNIVLNGGKITLERDLVLSGTTRLMGVGVVNLNKQNLFLGGRDHHITNTIFWQNPAAIILNSRTSLSGTWTFGRHISHIIGNGNILDLSGTGTLWLKAGSMLHLTDVKLKGLGNGDGSIVFEDHDSSLRLSHATIELSNNYSVTQGNFFVEGNTNIVTKNYKLIFDNKGTLTVDGSTLEYDTLEFNDNNNIVPLELVEKPANLSLKNNAIIRNIYSLVANVNINSVNHYLHNDIFIHLDNLLRINTSTTITGSGHAIRFARRKDDIMRIAANSTVYLKDVVLKDFDDRAVQLGSGAQLIFSEGTVIELPDSQPMSMNWIFSGNAKVHGFGNKINMNGNVIEVQKGGQLTLQDIRFERVEDNNIRCAREEGVIILDNIELTLSKAYSFTTGALRFEHDVVVTGSQVFTYLTRKSSTIASNSTLLFDIGSTFNYAPTGVGSTDGSFFSQTEIQDLASGLSDNFGVARSTTKLFPEIPKDLLVMTDKSSRLFLNGCTLKSSQAGLRLTKGTLVVDHKNFFQNYNNPNKRREMAITFGNGVVAADDLDLEIFPGGSIDLQEGMLDYNNVNG